MLIAKGVRHQIDIMTPLDAQPVKLPAAENDIKNAAHTIKLGEQCPTGTVCFHAQQCV